MNTHPQKTVPIQSESDIIIVRQTVRNTATALGFGVTDITRIVTGASELARNVYTYANTGTMQYRLLNARGRIGIELTFADDGPGIADVERALEIGYTTGNSLGMGLPGTKRLMDEMEIHSNVGQGTTVLVRKWMGAL